MNVYLEAFLPLFVAMNLLGILPLYVGLTEGTSEPTRRRVLMQAVTTAFVIATLVLFAGQFIFKTLGITVNDLRVGGGLILLVLSISDLIFGDYKRRNPSTSEDQTDTGIGIVPLGIPLIMGPVVITTIIVLQQSYGYLPTLVSMVVNLMLVTVAFFYGPALLRKLGANTSKAIAKVASLFLAAIAVAMIRVGVMEMILQA
ncbi:MAG: MarC family protein [Rhodothermales bacterium]